MDNHDMKILAIDDNRDNLTVLKAVLTDRLSGVKLLCASNGPNGLELARSEDPEVILLDIVMPGMDGYAVCRELKADEWLRAIPVLFLTALRTDRDSRIRAMDEGAEGFLAKPFDEIELIAQIRAMTKIKAANRLQQMEKEQLAALVADRTRDLEKELSERRKAEEALRQFKTIFDQANFGAVIGDPSGVLTYVNDCFAAAHGYTAPELTGKSLRRLHNESQLIQVDRLIRELVHTGSFMTEEVGHCRRDGATFPMLMNGMAIRDADGNLQCLAATAIDITERKSLEDQLAHAQKMESVGRLAGGVAHDFNNMLGVILGHAEMALDEADPDGPIYADLHEIRKAAERSASLTRQLLAFARRQTIAPKVLDLNETVESMLKMLRRLIGEDIDLAWLPGKSLWPVRIDPSQIDQILANLCVNARDAISGQGKITIETGNVVLDRNDCANHPEVAPGEYVLLLVSDDGIGMDPETIGKLFEPFFTTKEVGKGTGLGLATVYGIVKQNNAFITVSSNRGQGTTFRIFLLKYGGHFEANRPERGTTPESNGNETILLVEDEPTILNMTTMMLKRLGFTVLAASSPDQAIHLAKAHDGDIHLLMTDVVMPGMNGRELADTLMSVYPGMKRLFMSGYTADVIAHHGVLEPGVHFVQKPFSKLDLGKVVRKTLENDI